MRSHTVALLLVGLGLVCLPAPLYLSWAASATAPPPQTSQVYAAEPLDPADRSDRKRLVDRHGSATSLSIHQVSERYSAGEYRAPNRTRRALETAMRAGSTTVDDAAVRADLRTIARTDTFVYDAYGDDEGYYRLRVSGNGSTMRATPVSLARVADVTVERAAVRYTELSPEERATVDRILRNSSEDEFGYRPRVDDPFVDRLPVLVSRDGTLYSLHVAGHVDDLGPGFAAFFRGIVGTGIGVVLLVSGAVVYVVGGNAGDGDE